VAQATVYQPRQVAFELVCRSIDVTTSQALMTAPSRATHRSFPWVEL